MDKFVTIKSVFDEDLRRFSLAPNAALEHLCSQLVISYGFTKPFVVKYVDDEGDWISITTTEELREAFRLASSLRPPILRIKLMESDEGLPATAPQITEAPKASSAPAETAQAPSAPKQQEKEEELAQDEDKQYPPLDVSQWDAPKKVVKEMKVIPTKRREAAPVEEEAPTITAQMLRDCAATLVDINEYSRRGLNNAMEYFSSPNVALCSDLSKKIAAECSELSKKTAELCHQLSTIQTQVAHQDGKYESSLSDLALQTERECQRLSDETASISRKLARLGSADEAKRAEIERQIEAMKQQQATMEALSKAALEECDKLARATSDETARLSAEIAKLVMSL